MALPVAVGIPFFARHLTTLIDLRSSVRKSPEERVRGRVVSLALRGSRKAPYRRSSALPRFACAAINPGAVFSAPDTSGFIFKCETGRFRLSCASGHIKPQALQELCCWLRAVTLTSF